MGVAFVRGLQGDHPEYLQAAACAKHFAVHSGPEPLRHVFNVSPSETDLRETYLPAFEALCREAGVEIAMTAYNALYGIPCSVSPLLYGLLREWGFDGHITSDCGSVADLSRTHRLAADDAAAEALTVKAGMNVRCGFEPSALVESVRRGLLTEAELDTALFPLMRTMFRLGFFDPPGFVPFASIAPSENEAPAHGALALRAARESLVLLKNDGILPLRKESLRRVAVIGPNAGSVQALLGNYSGEPSAPVTVLAGIKAVLEPAGVEVRYVHGIDYARRTEAWRPIPHPWFNAEYFANPDLSGEPAARKMDRPICFGCDPARPAMILPPGIPASGISVRWTGTLQTTLPGEYRFIVRLRGGARFFVEGRAVIDSWAPLSGSEDREIEAVCTLAGNAAIPIRLDYTQGGGPVKIGLGWKTPPVDAQEGEALAAAAESDVVIYVGGISAQLEGEEMEVDYEGFAGGDRLGMELPELQQRFLEKLHAVGKPVVMVNLSGSAVAMPWADEHLSAILQAWYPGQEGGTAVAEALMGDCNPAGRLPLTFYRATGDLPDFKDYAMAGRTYRFFTGKALYPFGHGLSYTMFSYDGLSVKVNQDRSLTARLSVTNVGERDGEEVVQLYAAPPASAGQAGSAREIQSLCAFRRLALSRGETKEVSISVPAGALRRWSVEEHRYVIPKGEWIIRAAASSADIRQTAAVRIP